MTDAQPTKTIDYKEIKTALKTAGYQVTDCDAWTGVEAAAYKHFTRSVAYNAGVHDNDYKNNYGIPYPGEMPAAIAAAITGDQPQYSATFAGTPTSGQAPLAVNFTVTETNGKADTYDYDFGDGTAPVTGSTTPTLSHTYATAGTFTAKVTPHVGCEAKGPYSAAPVTVTAAYSATLTPSPASGTAPLDVTFTVTEENGAATSFEYDFGDGSRPVSQTSNTVSHTYSTAGSYTAKVTPIVDGKETGPFNATPVTVSAATSYTYSVAANPNPVNKAATCNFTVTESNGTASSFEVDFGDGSAKATESTTTFSHAFANAGTFTVSVVATVSGTAQPPQTVSVTVSAVN